MTIRRINLYGGPGVGKSTLAAKLFAQHKRDGQNVELIQEFVKELVYENRDLRPWDLVWTFGEQLKREHRALEGGVDLIITDSPLALQGIYAQRQGCPVAESILTMAFEFDKQYPARNFYIPRQTKFVSAGRYQKTEAEAIEVDQFIERYLQHLDIKFLMVNLLDLKGIDHWLHALLENR